MEKPLTLFLGEVKNGRVALDDKSMFQEYLSRFEGQRIALSLKKFSDNMTIPQNNWYWACVVGFPAWHFGYTKDEMHDAYKMMFLRKREIGKPETIGSSASLSKEEFSEYVEKCRNFCAEQGIEIPDPYENL